MNCRDTLAIVSCALGIVAWWPNTLASAPLHDIVDLGPGWAHDISERGQIVGTDGVNAVFWNDYDSAPTILHALGGTSAQAEAINEAGQIVGADYPQAVFWNDSSSTVAYLGAYNAVDINDGGEIVGYNPWQPLYWSSNNSSPTPINGDFAVANINNVGQLVGTNYDGRVYAVYWSSRNSAPIPLVGFGTGGPIAHSQGHDNNETGQMVGIAYTTDGARRPVFWNDGESSPIDLNTPNNIEGTATSINDVGQIVGFTGGGLEVGEQAVFWENAGASMIDLNTTIPSDSGWVLQNANDINNAGIIVGHGVINGEKHAYALIPHLDNDGDGVPDDVDICPGGDDTVDYDGDGVPDFCDPCPSDDQNDADGDGVCGDIDSCPGGDDNLNADGDGLPDFCDVCPVDIENDADGDGICESADNCPLTANSSQADNDLDEAGDVCDTDDDNDSYLDELDNCPLIANDQTDTDDDGVGDECDTDDDNDGVIDAIDLCLTSPTGEVVNADGCAIADLSPCSHPSGGDKWKNHGAYISSVAHVSQEFFAAGLITEAEKDAIISAAGQSSCGAKN